MNLLKTNLKILVKSKVPGNSTLVNAEEAEYILSLIDRQDKSREAMHYLDSFITCESNKHEHCPDCDTKYTATDIVDFSEATKAFEFLDLAFNNRD